MRELLRACQRLAGVWLANARHSAATLFLLRYSVRVFLSPGSRRLAEERDSSLQRVQTESVSNFGNRPFCVGPFASLCIGDPLVAHGQRFSEFCLGRLFQQGKPIFEHFLPLLAFENGIVGNRKAKLWCEFDLSRIDLHVHILRGIETCSQLGQIACDLGYLACFPGARLAVIPLLDRYLGMSSRIASQVRRSFLALASSAEEAPKVSCPRFGPLARWPSPEYPIMNVEYRTPNVE